MQVNVLDDLAEAMKALDGKKPKPKANTKQTNNHKPQNKQKKTRWSAGQFRNVSNLKNGDIAG